MLRVALVGFLWAVLAVSLVLLLVALGLWLVALVGKPVALALMGAGGVMVSGLGLAVAAGVSARGARPQSNAPPAALPDAFAGSSLESLTMQHPLGAVACAAAAGMLAASAEGDTLTRPLLEAALQSLR